MYHEINRLDVILASMFESYFGSFFIAGGVMRNEMNNLRLLNLRFVDFQMKNWNLGGLKLYLLLFIWGRSIAREGCDQHQIS